MHEPGTLWLPNNNYFPARNGYTPRYVILHGTAGYTSAEAVAAFFKSTEKGKKLFFKGMLFKREANKTFAIGPNITFL